MQIVINHLTKMQPGYICVAGIDTQTKKHVRPTLGRRLDDTTAARHGGVFAIGDVVDIGSTTDDGTPPEIEDSRFNPDNLEFVESMLPTHFWKLLCGAGKTSLEDIFGKDLEQRGRSYAVLEGKGSASLGCLILQKRSTLYVDGWGKLCISFENHNFIAQVKVNDLRMHKRDGTVNQKVVNAAISKIGGGHKVILSVGLARAFVAANDTERRHWLQVNNVHFANDPSWSTL
jgi:hypothetical protein